MTNLLEGPTYLAVKRYKDGEELVDETKLNATLQDAIYDLENLVQVVLIEDGKCIDQSLEAAEIWWAKNGHKCETAFDVPNFIHIHMHGQVYDEIAGSRYEANCHRDHEAGRSWSL